MSNERQILSQPPAETKSSASELSRLIEGRQIGEKDVTATAMIFDPYISGQAIEMARNMAKGHCTVPEHLRGSVGDCLAIVMQSAMWRLNPYSVAQKTHLIYGVLGYEAQLVNAVLASTGVMEGRFRYEEIGDWSRVAKRPNLILSQNKKEIPSPGWSEEDEDGLAIKVTAKLRDDKEPRSHILYLAQAWPRNSTMWAINPQQQLSYLAVKQWARRYAPDAILGVYTVDEIQERASSGTQDGYIGAEHVVGSAEDAVSRLNAMAKPRSEPEQSKPEWPKEIDGVLYAASGKHGLLVPWDEDFHAGTKSCTGDGTWRMRKGHDPELYRRWLDSLKSAEQPQDNGGRNAHLAISRKMDIAADRNDKDALLAAIREADESSELSEPQSEDLANYGADLLDSLETGGDPA